MDNKLDKKLDEKLEGWRCPGQLSLFEGPPGEDDGD